MTLAGRDPEGSTCGPLHAQRPAARDRRLGRPNAVHAARPLLRAAGPERIPSGALNTLNCEASGQARERPNVASGPRGARRGGVLGGHSGRVSQAVGVIAKLRHKKQLSGIVTVPRHPQPDRRCSNVTLKINDFK
ncbi:hypothetical protein E2C01_018073 [Portunus trituberculatus]|uniref:Uncharacterized protein n=1 Tax=Portunus trituberculatus TaxID=210409 RepID=A0A5B7DU57_PORTR|nr:hypothetical protein [Portunus trituberculatus]